jgi:hypothetical protein
LKAWLSSLVLATASMFAAPIALAQTADVHLIWERPVGSTCPARPALEADVEEILGRRVFVDVAHARVILRGVIADDPSGPRVRIEARSPSGALLGERTLTAPPGRCETLRDAIALVLTLFVDEESRVPLDAPDVRLAFGLSGSAISTPLPRMTSSAGPALSLGIGSLLRLRADAAAYWPVAIQTTRGVGARMYALSMALRACVRVLGEPSGFVLRVCAGSELGALTATPLGLAKGPARQTRLLAAGLLDLRLEKQLADFGLLDVALGPVLELSRPSISYLRSDGASMPVYRPSLTGVMMQLSLLLLGS